MPFAIKSRVKSMIKIGILCQSMLQVDIVLQLLMYFEVFEVDYYMYPRFFFMVIESYAMRKSIVSQAYAIVKSWKGLLLYVLAIFISSCFIFVAYHGPLQLKLHDNDLNEKWIFRYNFTTFFKTLYTVFQLQTTNIFPDVGLHDWRGNELIIGIPLFIYTLSMILFIVNILVGIFYTNYKNYYCNNFGKLDKQDKLAYSSIVAMTKTGNMSQKYLEMLVESMWFESHDDWMAKCDSVIFKSAIKTIRKEEIIKDEKSFDKGEDLVKAFNDIVNKSRNT